jgi:hypothetical protein
MTHLKMLPAMVMTPAAALRDLASTGKHSCRHRITSPRMERSIHSAELNTTGAVTTPREAGTPLPAPKREQISNEDRLL